MKKILLLLFVFSLTMHSQTSRIEYIVVLHNPKNSVKPMILETIENAEYMKFNLLFNEKRSSFEIEYLGLLNEELIRKQKRSGITEILVGYFNICHQDAEGNSTIIKTIDWDTYQINHNKKMNDWVITDEKKKIKDYECIKATRKEFNKRSGKYMNFIAWFTPEIKVPYGPAGYGGLPGLILELHHEKRFSYFAKNIELNKFKDDPLNLLEAEKISIYKSVELMRIARGQN